MLIAVSILSCCGGQTPPPSGALEATGDIEGTVRLVGAELPAPTRVANSTDPEVCGTEHTLEDLVVSPENGGVQHAIVAVTDVPSSAIPLLEPGRLVLDNANCRFSPHASVLTLGSTVEAVNSDTVLHTTHLYGPADINISLPVKGARSSRQLERPGMYVIKCDIHGWMQAFVRVDQHPYHAVTDETGSFRIEAVPAGSYTLEIWHERLGSRATEVRVKDGATISVPVEYVWPEN